MTIKIIDDRGEVFWFNPQTGQFKDIVISNKEKDIPNQQGIAFIREGELFFSTNAMTFGDRRQVVCLGGFEDTDHPDTPSGALTCFRESFTDGSCEQVSLEIRIKRLRVVVMKKQCVLVREQSEQSY